MLEKILGVVSWVVALVLPGVLMKPIDYYIGNNTAIAFIVILMFIRQKLSRKAKRVVFDALRDVRKLVPD